MICCFHFYLAKKFPSNKVCLLDLLPGKSFFVKATNPFCVFDYLLHTGSHRWVEKICSDRKWLTIWLHCEEFSISNWKNDCFSKVKLYPVSFEWDIPCFHRSSPLSELTAYTESIQTEIASVLRVTRKVAEECTIQSISDDIASSILDALALSHHLWFVSKIRFKYCEG